ncbi:hypothetical protein F5Y09DRAFT_275863 [Xylaria sp. FL1042]|nr:hypothetical protein F5Y09DRAFT_275863 [Xylaria sp. FL1042]
MCQFSISRLFDFLDLNSAAVIIALVKGNVISPRDGPEFLDGHIAEWRERSLHGRCGVKPMNIPDYYANFREHEIVGSVFMHYMRSFIMNLGEDSTHANPHASGLKCLREHITFRGYNNGRLTKLIEKRYSTALSLLLFQKPAAHYVLVSICDGQ